MATYVNNLRLKEIATGDEEGTWGASTNTNLELIADAFGSGTEAITTNANTHTTTIADGAADEGRAIFLKYTGDLDSDCTITIAPNTVNKLWLIENATGDSGSSGPYNIIISQGSGANITIGNGKVAAVFTDGAGSGAAVLDAFADLELMTSLTVGTDAIVGDDLTLKSDAAVLGFGADTDVTLTHVADTGLLLNSTRQLQFFDSSQRIAASSATVLSIAATDEIDLQATAIDVNGTVDMSSTLTVAGNADLNGDLDVDGTTNLDAVDIDGAVQIDEALTVGVDDTGYDVKFFGATSGAHMLWDQSTDDLILAGAAGLDVDGVTNLDAVDIDGPVQIDAAFTVGVDDTGYDVKFFGATASAYMLWDQSADDLILAGAAGLDVDGTTNLDNTDVDGTLVVDGSNISLDSTSTLNIDNSNTSNGITIGTATSGVPISIGHTTSEVTVNDNLTVTGTLTLGSGAELTEAELEMLDGITAGTVAASKAVVVDSNKDIASFRNVTLTGELDAGSLDVSGDADIDGTLETDALSINGTAVSSTAAELNILDGATVVVGEINYLDLGSTAVGTAIASKAVVLDSNKDYTGIRNLTITGELDAATLDISGAIDVEGTANLDVVDIDGAVDMASTLQVDGAITGSSTIQGTTITATTAFVPDASDGAALGTTSLEFSDLYLADGAVAAFGDDQDVTLTHVADTGLLLNSTMALQFNDASQYINAPSATVLDINATDEIELNATAVDLNGTLDVSGTTTLGGTLTVNAGAVFNEASADVDFRIEGNGDANLVYVDAGNDHVGIGTNAPSAKLHVKDSQDISMDASASGQVHIQGNGYSGAIALDGSNMNIYNNASSIGIVFGTNETARMSISSGGTVNVVGELTAGTKTFRIDHPLPSMTDTHTLSHASIEGPQADLMYRGSVDLQGGAATIDLDEAARMTSGTWAVLCRNPQVWVQNETGWTQVRGSVSGSTLTLSAQDSDCTDTVSWLVVAERNDSHYTDSKSTDDDGLFRLERNKAESKENGE
jgi:cytoskeletal protein CcmA (bactofilin family)